MATITYTESASGFYKVTLAEPANVGNFLYKPGLNTIVDKTTLDALIAADAVTNVVAAD